MTARAEFLEKAEANVDPESKPPATGEPEQQWERGEQLLCTKILL